MEQPHTNSPQGADLSKERPRGDGVQLGPKGQYMRNLPNAVKTEVERYRRTIGEVEATPKVPGDVRIDHTNKVRQVAQKRLKEAYDASEAEYNEKAAGFKKTIRPEVTGTNEKLLSRMTREASWRRIQAILDSEPDNALNVIREESLRAAVANDIETINALEDELPSYFRAKKMDEAYNKEATLRLDHARTITFSPQQAAAATQLRELDKVWKRSKVAYEHGNFALTQPIGDEAAIPDATDGETLTIAGYRATPPKLPGLDSE